MGFLSDFFSKLPDAFNKSENSNIGKLLQIISEQLDNVKQTLESVEEWRDIDNASGTPLDLLGYNVGQNRGLATDEIYRVMIRAKNARMISDGTANKIIKALAASLNCSVSDINVKFGYELEGDPAVVSITKAPLTALNAIGMSTDQFIQIVSNVVAGGIGVGNISLEGTFSFASGNTVETSDTGFADIGGTTGGTLGGVFTPSNDYQLPI